jgi:hypothetical protein
MYAEWEQTCRANQEIKTKCRCGPHSLYACIHHGSRYVSVERWAHTYSYIHIYIHTKTSKTKWSSVKTLNKYTQMCIAVKIVMFMQEVVDANTTRNRTWLFQAHFPWKNRTKTCWEKLNRHQTSREHSLFRLWFLCASCISCIFIRKYCRNRITKIHRNYVCRKITFCTSTQKLEKNIFFSSPERSCSKKGCLMHQRMFSMAKVMGWHGLGPVLA